MKIVLTTAYAISALLFTILGTASFAAENANKPTAIYYHADWCPNCQALSPKFQQASLDIQGLDVLVVDYTDMETTANSQKKAMEMGLFEVIANNRHTGFVLLLDADKKELGRLYRTSSTDDIRKELTALASGS